MVLQRMCTVCRERREKKELLRITKSNDGIISIDNDGKMPGRGAYICRNGECLKNAEKRRVLERSFGCKVDGDIYKKLSELSDTNGYKD